MGIDMSKKVDVYLKNPGYFQHDLNNQKSIWMDNLVRPVSGHYEAALKAVEGVFAEAKRRTREHQARLAKIEAAQAVVIGVLLAGVDIASAAALKPVTILGRYGSHKGLEHFLTQGKPTAMAVKNFLSQPNLIIDGVLGNLDDKIKGLATTGSAKSAYTTVKALTAKVKVAVPKDPSAGWPGAVQFKSRLETTYSTMARAINEAFVKMVRDGDASAEVKRSLVEHLVVTPFVRPPSLSMASFGPMYKNYFEACYWCDYISSVPSRGYLNDKGVDKSRTAGVMRDGILADTINERLYKLTGMYLTHTGSKKAAASGRGPDIRMAWDGWVNKSTHAAHLGKMRAKVYTNNVKPLMTAAGQSTTK